MHQREIYIHERVHVITALPACHASHGHPVNDGFYSRKKYSKFLNFWLTPVCAIASARQHLSTSSFGTVLCNAVHSLNVPRVHHIPSTGIRTHSPPSRERRWRLGFLASRERYLDLAASIVVVSKSRDACPHKTPFTPGKGLKKTEGTTH
jgi:hypothetical protein